MDFKVVYRFVVFCVCCAVVTTTFAQQEITSRYYSMKDGLSNDAALSLLQDSKGFLWVGTYAGLNKFDGYHFTNYRENPYDSSGLIGDIVQCLWEDDQQRLWIGTEAGLQLFDLTTEKFQHLATDYTDPAKGFSMFTHKIRERKDGKLWICTSNGIYLADPRTLAITKVNIKNGSRTLKDSVSGDFFSDVAEAHDGKIWAASQQGLVHIDSHTGETTRYLHDPGDPKSLSSDLVRTVYIDNHDRIWAGTDQGLDLFNPLDRSFTHYLTGKLVLSMLEDPDGKLWIGAFPGLYTFTPDTEKFGVLLSQYIWSISQDKQGIMWIATANGLYQITQGKDKFRYERQFGSSSVADVRVFTEDKNHHIWIAVQDSVHRLFRYDPSSKRYFQYQHDPSDPYSFSGDNVRGIIPDNDGGVWIGSYLNLHKFNPQDQTFLNISIPFQVTTLLKDSEGKIWLGKWQGVEVYDPQSNKLEPLKNFPLTEVTSMVEDPKGNIWIGTNFGLFRYGLKTNQLGIFKHNVADPQSISNNKIAHLIRDQQGTVWIGTFGGLNKLVPGVEPKFKHWRTTNSHIPHDVVLGVVDGGDGTLWMSCGNRISHFFPQTEVFRNYDHSDGLQGHLVYKGVRSHHGEIYFSSRDGMIAFQPDSPKDNLYVPPLAITGFYIQNEPVPLIGSYADTASSKPPLTHTITYTDDVALSHLQNDLTFEFAALNYNKQEKNQYKYRLEPYEKKWIETNADNRIARYTNLSPGRYTFRVIGSNNDGIWNEEGVTLVIVIAPPWWKTWWAYSLYAIVFAGLLLSARRIIIQRERLAARLKLEHLELEKAQEIDKVKTNFFSNISHEFRTPITLIQGPLKEMYNKAANKKERSTIGIMLRNAQRLSKLINQLLDLSKLEARKMTLHASPIELVQFLREIVSSYESLASNKNIKYLFYPEVHELTVYIDGDKMEKVVHNLLSNAFKFTKENGEVIVYLKADGSHCNIVVKDTGIGIPTVELDKVFDRFHQVDSSQTRSYEGSGLGMALAKELTELHHGTIAVESVVGKGTTFTVRLPLGKEHFTKDQIVDDPNLKKNETYYEDLAVVNDNHESGHEKVIERDHPILLIVEDNDDMRHYIRKTFVDQYQIIEAGNGKEGIAKAKEAIPDLIISDVMMPEMDGYQFCEHIKTNELTCHIPVILLTAKADRESKLTGLETGADDYLCKPFDSNELKLIIRNRIEQRRKIRERFSREVSLQPKQIAITSFDEKFINKVLSIVENHIGDENFTIDGLSREAGYSNMHFYRKIKGLTGETPSQFLRTIRLKRAAELLRAKSDNVTQIAYSVGFNSLSYFNKCFKEQFGVTPGQFAEKSIGI